MQFLTQLTSVPDILPLRELYRGEMNCQITKDSIHRREGWTLPYRFTLGDLTAGYGLVAIGGPWTNKPTVIEFYVLPAFRTRVFEVFENFLAASGARLVETQSNTGLLTDLLLTWSRDVVSDKIVFHDQVTTTLPANGAVLRRINSLVESRNCVEQRQGGSEWCLELEGTVVATGGILFHYNRPYGDIYMDVAEPFRRRGLGSYLVQELKRVCREELASIPCARCSPDNLASRQTLQKAGFVPCAHILTGSITGA